MGLSVNAHCSTKAKSEVKYNLAFGINSPITPINYYRAKDKDSWEAGHESAISGSKLFIAIKESLYKFAYLSKPFSREPRMRS